MARQRGWKQWIGPVLGSIVLLMVLYPILAFRDVPYRVRSLGAGYAKVFQNPDTVEVYELVENPPDSRGISMPMAVVEPSNLGQRVVPNARWISAFRSWTRVKDSPNVTACEPDPGFDVRLKRGNRSLDILICLKCGKVAATPTGVRTTHWGQIGEQDRIVLLLNQLFPKDADLSDMAAAYTGHGR